MNPIIILILAQLLFTASDLLGRKYMLLYGFHLTTFFSAWFAAYFVLRMVAMFAQLYIFSKFELGATMAMFGAVSIILANLLGFLLLKEVLTINQYMGVVLAVIAFLIIAFAGNKL